MELFYLDSQGYLTLHVSKHMDLYAPKGEFYSTLNTNIKYTRIHIYMKIQLWGQRSGLRCHPGWGAVRGAAGLLGPCCVCLLFVLCASNMAVFAL